MRNINLFASLLHLAILLFAIFYPKHKQADPETELFIHELQLRETIQNENRLCPTDVIQGFGNSGVHVNILNLTYAFIVITILAHLIYAAFPQTFQKKIKLGTNPYRWVEYSLSASLMLVVLTILSMNRNLYLIVFVFLGTIVLMMQGYFIERAISRLRLYDVKYYMAIGWIVIFAIWFPIFSHYYRSMEFYQEHKREDNLVPPDSLQHLIWIMFFFFCTFGINNFTHFWKARQLSKAKISKKDVLESVNSYFKKVEFRYIFLSFTSKAVLVLWIVLVILTTPLAWIHAPGHVQSTAI